MDDSSFLPTYEDCTCKFVTVFGGRCGKEAKDGLCEEHQGIICIKCENPTAIKECGFVDYGNNTVSDFFVCLANICENCQHTPHIPVIAMIPDRHTHVTKEEAALMEIMAPAVWTETGSN